MSAALESLRREKSSLMQERTITAQKKKDLKEELKRVDASILERAKSLRNLEKNIERDNRRDKDIGLRFDDSTLGKKELNAQLEEKKADRIALEQSLEVLKQEITHKEEELKTVEANYDVELKSKDASALSNKQLEITLSQMEKQLELAVALQEEDERKANELAREANLLRDAINKADSVRMVVKLATCSRKPYPLEYCKASPSGGVEAAQRCPDMRNLAV